MIRVFRNTYDYNNDYTGAEMYHDGGWIEDGKHEGDSFRHQIIDAAVESPGTAEEAPWLLDQFIRDNPTYLAGGHGHVLFVALDSEEGLQGYREVVWDGASEVESKYTWVLPSQRGNGVGTRLDQALYDVFGPTISVYLWARDGHAHRFWANRGYMDTGETEDVHENGKELRLHRMKKITLRM